MSIFGKLFIFGSGIISGIYLDQTYTLPNVEKKFNEYYEQMKRYEPPKKPPTNN